MGGITDLINSLASSFGFQVAPWFFPAMLVAVGVMVYPSIAKTEKGRKARRLIENYGTTSGVQRDELRARILSLVKGDGPGLQMVLEKAEASSWTKLADDARAELQNVGGAEFVEVQKAMAAKKKPMLLDAEFGALERFIENGLWVRAEERVTAALAEWPDEPQLLALQAQIARREGATGAPKTDSDD
jgi:hypothetical protein